MVSLELKKKVHQKIINSLNDGIELASKSIADLEAARDGETKSSMGDKYETSRSVIQFEKEKQEAQLNRLKHFLNQVKIINHSKSCTSIEEGSLIQTNEGYYYFSVAIGKIEIENRKINCINLNSPYGREMRGKEVKEKVEFRGRLIEVLSIV